MARWEGVYANRKLRYEVLGKQDPMHCRVVDQAWMIRDTLAGNEVSCATQKCL